MSTSMYNEVMDQKHTIDAVIEQFGKSVQSIRTAIIGKPLFFVGTGASYNACRAARDVFVLRTGVFPQILHAAEALEFPVSCFSGAAVIIASQSGESHETKLLCKHLENSDALIIALTMTPNSTLAKHADHIMFADVGPEVSSATKTYTAQMMMLFMLAIGERTECISAIQSDMKDTIDIIDTKKDALCGGIASNKYGYIAGVRELEPAAAQASLMLKEKCFLCYEGMSINELRHGTIEAVEPGMNIIVMCTGEEGFKDALIHVGFLNRIGANTFLVHDWGETDILPPDRIIKIKNRSKPEFANIVFAPFGQLVAERIASVAGYDVDGFRYLAKIVESY